MSETLKPCQVSSDFFGWNYLDGKGQLLSKRNFVSAKEFSEGYAAVQLDVFVWNYIDEHGRVAFPKLEISDAKNFRFGKAAVRLMNGTWNYINARGEIVFPKKTFGECFDFIGRVAPVSLDEHSCDFRLLRDDGDIIRGKKFVSIGEFSQGFLLVNINEHQRNFIDSDGNFLLKTHVQVAYPFRYSVARVQLNDGLWNYVQTDGKFLFSESFISATPFDNRGTAVVETFPGCFAVVGINGKFIFNRTFKSPLDASIAIDERIEEIKFIENIIA